MTRKTKLFFSALGAIMMLFVSCKEKDKSAKDAKASQSAESKTEAKQEPDLGGWFMAQTQVAPVKSVVATSELVEAQFEGRFLYPPINILDGDFDKTWCEADENGSGLGESITVEFSEPVSFDEIQIVNGFASKDYYFKNNRVKSIQLTQTATRTVIKDAGSSNEPRTETQNHFQQKDYTLQDGVDGWQSILFELPQTAQTITIKITDVYKGEKYDDTCLDDIRLLYKGSVIPFANISELKALQEENSKQMLADRSESTFVRQFYGLFDGNDRIYLKDKKTGELLTLLSCEDGSIDFVYGDSELITTDCSREEFENKIRNSEHSYLYVNDKDFFDDLVAIPETKYVLLGWMWSPGRASYALGNHRILKTEYISYVETTTSIITKISGDKIYLNGTEYSVIPGTLVTDWRNWDGP